MSTPAVGPGFWDKPLDRGPYLLIGIVLFALKYNIDRIVAYNFGRKWSPFNYLIMPAENARVDQVAGQDTNFYATLLAISLPFIAVGVVLTLKRLRSIPLPNWLVVFFFLPFINMLFFIILAVLPSREKGNYSPNESSVKRFLNRIIPDNPVGSAAMSLLITIPLTIGLTATSVSVLGNYGWSVFVGLPFTLGLISVLIYGYHRQRGFLSCMVVSLISVSFLGLGLMAVALEGAICIMMAAPIGFVLGGIGGVIGWVIQRQPWSQNEAHRLSVILLLIMPVLMGAESRNPAEAPIIPVATAIEIDAPPATVWRNVVTFSELPEPDSWLFKAGVAFPIRAEIQGQGVGAIRYCRFSTGPFVEPIEIWDEPRLLKFSVTAQPPAMEELSPYGHIDAPHLNNYLVSKGGQFLLTELPGGRTRLEGTTWYYHKIWPYTYWQVWSDAIIHRIHMRVLNHIKTLSEKKDKKS